MQIPIGVNLMWYHFIYEVANKCLNVCELVEMVERNKDGSLPSHGAL